jgi:hypothetical protein
MDPVLRGRIPLDPDGVPLILYGGDTVRVLDFGAVTVEPECMID